MNHANKQIFQIKIVLLQLFEYTNTMNIIADLTLLSSSNDLS